MPIATARRTRRRSLSVPMDRRTRSRRKGTWSSPAATATQVNTRVAHIDLGPKSEPEQAILDGGVLYVASNESRLLHGSASSGTLSFGPALQPTIRHAQFAQHCFHGR